jgi:hypothetical protein
VSAALFVTVYVLLVFPVQGATTLLVLVLLVKTGAVGVPETFTAKGVAAVPFPQELEGVQVMLPPPVPLLTVIELVL